MSLEHMVIPKHVAVILDGNGRWAKRRGVPRAMGHKAGCETLEKMVRIASDTGIEYFTVYGFSTENWKRSTEEVGALMQLFRYYMVRLLKIASANNVRVRMIGDKRRFAPDIIKGIDDLVEGTKDNTGMTFVIAINYGGRDEIVRAVKKIAEEAEAGRLKSHEITEERMSGFLDTAGLPEPDLLIRTCNEQRISNFLLWQLAYTEFYFTPIPWPDFTREELIKAVEAYNHRDRRHGGLSSG